MYVMYVYIYIYVSWTTLDVRTALHAWGFWDFAYATGHGSSHEVQKRGRFAEGSPGVSRSVTSSKGPGGHGWSPFEGIVFWGWTPEFPEVGWCRFPYPCGLLPGEPHICIYIYMYITYAYVCIYKIFMHSWNTSDYDGWTWIQSIYAEIISW